MKRHLAASILWIAAIWALGAASWTLAKVQREHLEFLRDEITASCWRCWYRDHGSDVAPQTRDWNGRTIPVECAVP